MTVIVHVLLTKRAEEFARSHTCDTLQKYNTHTPLAPVSSSAIGLNSSVPAIAMAVTVSGDVTKACVCGLASLRPVKLRLYDVTIVFLSPFLMSSLAGDHATFSERFTFLGLIFFNNQAQEKSTMLPLKQINLTFSTVQCMDRTHSPKQCLRNSRKP